MASKPIPKLILCKGHNTPYLKCIGNRKETEYYMSRSIFAQGRKVAYCKTCVEAIFEYYLEQGSIMSATYYTCQKLDVPFIMECFQELIEVKEADEDGTSKKVTKNYIGRYMTILNSKKDRNMLWRDFSDTDVDISEIDSKLKTKEVKKKELEKFQLDWGYQEENDYIFLEYRFDTYTMNKPLTTAEETLYRQLCLVELAKRKKEEKKDSTKEEQDMMLKLMTKLKIDNFNEQKDKSEIERILEKQIWEIENTEPCEVFDKKEYEDMLDIKKNYYKHIIRACKNLVAGNRDFPKVEKDEWD
jgi:hypothetical protein